MATLADQYLSHSNHYHCDQYRDGSGWLTHHLALSSAFEASLQAVDGGVSLPYWDFTIEGQAIEDAGEAPSYLLSVSPIYTDEYCGAVNRYSCLSL